ncbi:MAG: hypothetical protein EBT20_21645, partial [Alphaproteobacteria bacterium]|nr:hypothetical protein [Alphaproteobacteria bacterium]
GTLTAKTAKMIAPPPMPKAAVMKDVTKLINTKNMAMDGTISFGKITAKSTTSNLIIIAMVLVPILTLLAYL